MLQNNFHHLYIEDQVKEHPEAIRIGNLFPKSHKIFVRHYKDLFNRSNQSFNNQKKTTNLILAKKESSFFYEINDSVIQNFGQNEYYYSSTILNCIYDCDYCYLQGAYSSAYLVIFVNIEDFISQCIHASKIKPSIFAISYDSDLLAVEKITGHAKKWINAASNNKNMSIELRTKSTNFDCIKKLPAHPNVILSWTLSPSTVSKNYEKSCPDNSLRMKSVSQAIKLGWQVRLCFDPILYLPEWKTIYKNFIETLSQEIDLSKIRDCYIDTFRINRNYLKKMKKRHIDHPLLNFPFETNNQIASYPETVRHELIYFFKSEISNFISLDKVFTPAT